MYIVDCATCIPFSIVTKYIELACSYVKSSCLGMHMHDTCELCSYINFMELCAIYSISKLVT